MISHNRPTLGKEEEDAALRVIQSNQLSQSHEVESFENEFCNFIGLPNGHAVALSSGTSSLFVSLWALNGYKKKILFPNYVCSALRHAVGMIQGTEVLVDNIENSPNLDMQKVKTSSHDIEIIPHMYGIPIKLTKTNNSSIIEDCCQSLGAKVNEEFVGLQGNIGFFSFYATKLITSGGQGGMIISKNKDLVDKIKDYREFDMRHDKKKRFNFQMTDLQAAIGREQLKKLPNFIKRREQIFQLYKKEGLNLLDIKPEEESYLKPVRYRAIIQTKKPKQIIESLKLIDVEAIIPTEDWELLGNHSYFPNGTKLSQETVSIPIYPSLTNEQINIILSGLIKK
jgi:perosamine synthetase